MQPSHEAVIPLRLSEAQVGSEHGAWEHVAYLLPGALPTLIDPGPVWLSDQLDAALIAVGFQLSAVQQVLLTSQAREIAGGAARLTNAPIFAVPVPAQDRLLLAHRNTAIALGNEVVAATAASERTRAAWSSWCDRHRPNAEAFLQVRPLSDGAVLLAGDLTLVASHRPAFSDTGAVFASLDGSLLFAGEFGVLDEDLPVGDWQAFAEGLGAITQGTLPQRLYPSRGRIEATGQVAFRAMALSANNLISNLPLALNRPATLQQLFERDLGYWPQAIAESALRLTRLRAALEELTRAGVVHRQKSATMLETAYAMVPV